MTDNPLLIDARALAQALDTVKVVDASWYLPADQRDPAAEYAEGHVPGAVFFDHDAVSDPDGAFPHTLPSAAHFGAAMGALGLTVSDDIVVYDGAGLFSAARAWWLLRRFGARNVRVLDGGLPAWRAAGLPLESGSNEPAPAHFAATDHAGDALDLTAMRALVAAGTAQIADARSAPRYAGSAPEPRPGVRSGHMPGARSVPYGDLQVNGHLKSAAELRSAFEGAGIDPDAPVVTSCGSGITAAVLNLALESLGNRGSKLYDGSWTEWGSQPDTPVETGPAPERGLKN